jgi:hypothetical protein
MTSGEATGPHRPPPERWFAVGAGREAKMLIGRSDDPHNPCRVAAFEVTHPFGRGSRNRSGPAAACRAKQAGHTTATAPQQNSPVPPLAPRGPSTHILPYWWISLRSTHPTSYSGWRITPRGLYGSVYRVVLLDRAKAAFDTESLLHRVRIGREGIGRYLGRAKHAGANRRGTRGCCRRSACRPVRK